MQIEKTTESVQRTGRGEAGMISVSMALAMAYGVVPQLLRRFPSEVTGVRLQLTKTITSLQERAILDGMIDIGFCYGAIQSNDLVSSASPGSRSSCSTVLSPGRKKRTIHLRDLKGSCSPFPDP